MISATFDVGWVHRMTKRLSRSELRPLAFWLVGFFALWGCALWRSEQWGDVAQHWVLALLVGVRSLLGAFAPIGSGAAGLPWLLATGDNSLDAARTWGLSVQIVGMTSAITLILCRRLTVDWPMVRSGVWGCLFGTPLGLRYFAPLVPRTWAIVLYCAVWCAFGLTLLQWGRVIAERPDQRVPPGTKLTKFAFLAGWLGGGCFGSVLGGGAAIPFYVVMVLLRRTSLRTAMTSCAMLMGFNAFLSLAFLSVVGGLEPAALGRWLATAPVVCVGVPLGFLVLQRCPPRFLLLLAAVSCLAAAAWMLVRFQSDLGGGGLLAVGLGVLYLTKACWTLNLLGDVKAEIRRQS